jgi:hypothetical protein
VLPLCRAGFVARQSHCSSFSPSYLETRFRASTDGCAMLAVRRRQTAAGSKLPLVAGDAASVSGAGCAEWSNGARRGPKVRCNRSRRSSIWDGDGGVKRSGGGQCAAETPVASAAASERGPDLVPGHPSAAAPGLPARRSILGRELPVPRRLVCGWHSSCFWRLRSTIVVKVGIPPRYPPPHAPIVGELTATSKAASTLPGSSWPTWWPTKLSTPPSPPRPLPLICVHSMRFDDDVLPQARVPRYCRVPANPRLDE